ncbi:PEP-CTERM sorting domain-containing protein [Aeoliella sp.]|uniref:PEP-CTERM sorting domain-containing protein n=1 Tax=Aeoliella sp. TaxID=2795800 RepID=UPI003CCC125C
MNLPTRHIVVGLLAWCLFTSGASADTAIWTGPATGDWDDPANWSTGVVPTAGDLVLIDDNTGQMSNVTAGTVAEVDELRVDAGDTLSVLDFTTNSVTLAGDLLVPDGGNFRNDNSLLIETTGRLLLGKDMSETQATSAPDIGSITNLGTIEGAGVLESLGSLANEGVISANMAGKELQVIAKVDFQNEVVLMTNTGMLEATNGGELRIGGSHPLARLINEKDGVAGQIVAHPQSLIKLQNIQVEGGSIATLIDETGSGVVHVSGILVDTTLSGTIVVSQSGLGGTIHNTGKIVAWSFGPASLEGGNLVGGGVVELGDDDVGGGTIGGPFINHDNAIRGQGAIAKGFVNRGLIEPGYGEGLESPYRITFRGYPVDPDYVTNAGTARATAGNTIGLSEALLRNYEGETDGLIEAAPGGVVTLNRSEVTGGVLRAVPAPDGSPLADGKFEFLYTESKLTDVKLDGNFGDSSSQLTLEGKIELDGSLELGTLYLEHDSETEIVGGQLIIGRDDGRITTIPPFRGPLSTLTLRDTTLRLYDGSVDGYFNMRIVNEGNIVSSQDGDFGLLAPIENAGLIHAEQGSQLSLGSVVTQEDAAAARLQVDEDAYIVTGRLIGGTVHTAPGMGEHPYSGYVVVYGSSIPDYSTFQDVTNYGHILLDFNRHLVAGEIKNHGLIEVRADIYQGSTVLTFSGDGETVLHEDMFAPPTEPDYIFTNGAGHTLRFMDGDLIDFSAATFINKGTFQIDGRRPDISTNQGGRFEQRGVLQVEGSTELTLLLSQESFDNEGSIDIAELARLVIDGTPLVNNQPASSLSVAGTLDIESATLRNHADATITGNGTISGYTHTSGVMNLANDGLIAPGPALGTLQIIGDFSQSATGRLQVDVDGFTMQAHDSLKVYHTDFYYGGNATLAGALEFQFADGLTPQLGDEVEFFSADSITGQFDTITGLPTLEAGLAWRLLYEPTSVTAAVTLAGDFNLDGIVNLADYTLWRNSVGAMGPALAADANGDSVVDTADYDLWRTYFGNTTADFPAAASQAVPEPGAVWLLLAGFVAMAVARRRSVQ